MAKLLSNTFYWFSDSLVKGWLALFMRENAAIQSHSEWTFFLYKSCLKLKHQTEPKMDQPYFGLSMIFTFVKIRWKIKKWFSSAPDVQYRKSRFFESAKCELNCSCQFSAWASELQQLSWGSMHNANFFTFAQQMYKSMSVQNMVQVVSAQLELKTSKHPD